MQQSSIRRYQVMIFSFMLSVAGIHAQTQTPFFRTGEVTCVSNDARLVSVRSIYSASTASDAQRWAERNALENLLFKGVAGCSEIPLVSDESASMRQNPDFYNWLIIQREFDRFITERSITSKKISKKNYWAEETLTFDMVALRSELEKKNIIKKFGF